MSALDQIVYRVPSGTGGTIVPAAASLRDRSETDRWLNRLDPWLRTGAPAGRGYLNFGSQAALLRWKDDPAAVGSWHFAHVLVGQAAVAERRLRAAIAGPSGRTAPAVPDGSPSSGRWNQPGRQGSGEVPGEAGAVSRRRGTAGAAAVPPARRVSGR